MDDFTRGLKKSVQVTLGKDSDWGVNPLVVIGLTEAMLDLELTEEQMFKAVRGYVRQLAGQIHPDQANSRISVERQRQIFEAFEVLDDRRRFSKALEEFRLLKSEDRKEIRILSQSLARAQQELASAQSRESTVSREQRKLERDKQIFYREERKRKSAITELRLEANRSATDYRRARVQAGVWKGRFDRLSFYTYLLMDDIGLEEVPGVHAFDAKWLCVVSLVNPDTRPNDSQRILDDKGVVVQPFVDAMNSLEIQEESQRVIVKNWKSALKMLGSPEDQDFQGRYVPRLTLATLSSGKPSIVYGSTSTLFGGRVVGSIPPNRMEIGRRQLTHLVDRDSLFESISPTLVVGGLAIHGKLLKLERGLSTQKKAIQRFNTKFVILGVG